jgi:hypothetical protein
MPKLIDVKSIHPSKSSQPRGPRRAQSTGESKNGGSGGVGYAATTAINDGLELLIFAVLSKRDRLTSGNRRHPPIY